MRQRIVKSEGNSNTGAVRRGSGTINILIDEIADSIPDKELLLKDIVTYLGKDVNSLPAFNEDGSVAMYEIGGILLGRLSLVRFIERCR